MADQSLRNSLLPYSQRFADIEPEKIRWLSQSRIAEGKITMVDGDPGTGKSSIVLDWVARITRGDNLPYGPKPDRPRGVIILSAEDGKADTIRPRLDAVGADVTRVIHFAMRNNDTGDEFFPEFPGDLWGLERAIEATDAALVVIDPLVAYVESRLRANSDQDMRRMMSPLSSMLERSRAANVCIRHLNKDESKASLYRGGGSIGIIGAARFGLLVARDPEDETGARRIVAIQKCNLGPEDQPSLAYRLESIPGADVARVVWEGESPLRAADLLVRTTAETREEKAILEEARQWVVDMLAGGSIRVDELKREAERIGFKWNTVRVARQHIPELWSGRIGFGPGAYYVWRLGKPEA